MRFPRKSGHEDKQIRLLETSGKSTAQIKRGPGIGAGCLSRWKRKLSEDDGNAFPGHGRLTPESGHLLATKRMRFQLIDDHWDGFPVTRQCKVLDVSSSGYYAWRKRPVSAREVANRELVERIKIVHAESRETYGSPRIYQELKAQGVACSENRVARLMRLYHIRAKQTRYYKVTAKCNKAHPVAPNVLQRDFAADRPNQKWLADITYIPTLEGWLTWLLCWTCTAGA